jgi:SWI/SNF-related matrix-associated actin-dependent regulator of chromatin subfamily B protein 1
VLKDRFVWDINNRRNSPEAFAQCVCADLGLGPELATALAHAIREQVTYYQKKEQMRGTPVVDQLQEIYRSNPEEWEPKVQVLSPDEVRRR